MFVSAEQFEIFVCYPIFRLIQFSCPVKSLYMTSRDLTVYSCPNICTVFCSILIFPSCVSHSASRLSLSTSSSCPSGEKEKKKKKSPVNFIISPAEWMLYFPRVQICLFFSFLFLWSAAPFIAQTYRTSQVCTRC